ncbi:MAG TPA: sigma-70 family RNA polymerase sigma factor [Steroidobacteraceae bacterium]|nr:sigma-70 family RNA polymerase sigma factor [Steroidobacteraceae bacterium]
MSGTELPVVTVDVPRNGASDDEHEQELLRKVAAQDREAFQQLYHLYYRRLIRFLMRLTRRREVAEEIINDTLWVVWRKAGEFRGGSLVSTWILGIAYRRGLKTLRRERVAENAPPDAGETEIVDEAQPARERADLLEQALAQLAVEQRMALELAYYLGYSVEEIAQIMSCPANTVKTRMYYARQRMKALLGALDP